MSNPEETTRTVVLERIFKHPPEKLWRALTETSLIAQWLMNNDFEPVVGRTFQFRSDPVPNWNGLIDCEVLTVDPLKQLSYTWESFGLRSVVLWTLTPTDDGTQLRMEHSGFPPDQKAAYQGATYGWNKFISSLETVLERLD
jgi:uncharacterized protein YndB with AHSA1/START domain